MNLNVTPEQKAQMAHLFTECQVLQNLLRRSETALKQKAKDILTANGLSTELYNLTFNLGKDLWEAQLKEDVLTLPNQPVPPKLTKN